MSTFEIKTPNNGKMVCVAEANTMDEAVEIMNSQQSLLDAVGVFASAVVMRIKDQVIVADGMMGSFSSHYSELLNTSNTVEFSF